MDKILSKMATLNLPQDPADFPEWFWTNSNGNNLIRVLNFYALEKKIGDDRIRREKEYPCVYALALNNFSKTEGSDWKLVKVGFTHKSTKKDSNNRMEQLTKEIESKLNPGETASNPPVTVATLFALRIGSVDTTPFHETENRIRRKVGTPIKKEKAKELNLPVPTEWVLTPQSHINKMKVAIEKMKKFTGKGDEKLKKGDEKLKKGDEKLKKGDEKLKKGEVDITAVPDLIDVFLSKWSPPTPPLPPTDHEFQDWIQKEAGEEEPKKEN